MLDGIEVNVVDMSQKIAFAADGVLPESAVPNACLTVTLLGGRDLKSWGAREVLLREKDFHSPNAF
jgi:hypothetical protein